MQESHGVHGSADPNQPESVSVYNYDVKTNVRGAECCMCVPCQRLFLSQAQQAREVCTCFENSMSSEVAQGCDGLAVLMYEPGVMLDALLWDHNSRQVFTHFGTMWHVTLLSTYGTAP